MALFDKKVEAVIAFVGKYTQRVSALQERAITNTYRPRLQSLVRHHYPGVSEYRVWFFRNWTDEIYSDSTLRRVAADGFNAYDSGEKKTCTTRSLSASGYLGERQKYSFSKILKP